MPRYALIGSDGVEVENVILADDSYTIKGQMLIPLNGDILCQPGMFYNVIDGGFYFDEAFTQKELFQESGRG